MDRYVDLNYLHVMAQDATRLMFGVKRTTKIDIGVWRMSHVSYTDEMFEFRLYIAALEDENHNEISGSIRIDFNSVNEIERWIDHHKILFRRF